MTPEEIAQLQAENDRLRKENDTYKEEVKQAQKAQNADFLDDLMSKGKLAPRVKEKAEKLLNYANEYDNGETLEFNEGESLTQQIKDFLNEQPQIVIFEEIATKERAYNEEADTPSYANNADPKAVEMDQKIRRYMAKHKVGYTDAFLAITQGE